jgi:hypothetical protein
MDKRTKDQARDELNGAATLDAQIRGQLAVINGSTFRKPKAEPKHARSEVKLYGTWQDRDHELDFMDRVVSVFHSMSRECHLHVTSAGSVLTVLAVMQFNGGVHPSITFTYYQWSAERKQWTIIERVPVPY